MPRIAEPHYDFRGGFNSRDNPTDLAPEYLSDVRNMKYDVSGALSSRNGFAKITSSSALSARAVTSGTRFNKDDGTTRFDVAFSNQTMYKLGSGAGTSMDTTSFTQDSVFTFATFGNNLYYGNGIEAPRKWTGTGNAGAMGGTPPTAKYITTSTTGQRLFMAGDTSNIARLYWSALGNAEDWTTANDAGFLDVRTDDGEPITGIREINGVLVIFKTSSTHILTGNAPSNFTLRQINPEIGCVAPYSIGANDREIFFAANDGFYACNGTQLRKISRLIDPTYQTLTSKSNIRGSVYMNGHIYVASVSLSTAYDRIFTYDFLISKEGAWSIYDSHSANSFWVHSGEDGAMYFGGPTGHVYQFDSGTSDAGSTINFLARTAWLTLKQPDRKKRFKRLHLFMEPSGSYNVTVTTFLNWISSGGVDSTVALSPAGATWASFTWGAASWGASEQAKHYIVPTTGKADSVMFKIACSNPFKIFGFTLISKPKHRK